MAIQLLLVESHQSLRRGICALLADVADISSITEAPTLDVAITCAHDHQPDVILLGLLLNPADMHSAITELRRAAPGSRVIVLGLDEDPAYEYAAVNDGASAYLLKDSIYDNLTTTIRDALPAGV